MTAREVPTRPYADQKPGTAGLRKKVAVFQQPHYLENFLQAIFDTEPALHGATLVIGGDGRFHNRLAIGTAVAMACANGVQRVVVGHGGLLSTPAASHLIRLHGAAGGLLFTASHNPAGPDGDFGLKFNVAGGGQANEDLTDRIFATSRRLSRYLIDDSVVPDLDRKGVSHAGSTTIEVVDAVDDYARLMQQLFDFEKIRDWLKRGHSMRFDAMHAVTGPYAQRLLVEQLGAPPSSLVNAIPLADFGGQHPDPNLIHARSLVDFMYSETAADLAAASDGDGDRNMILGRGLFVSPGDSLAMLAAQLHQLPGYREGLVGVARSMPTCRALDRVATQLGIPCYETPTGWKFFANLLDAGRITLCGEESFGTSSNHVREKDGLWAALAWLNVLAVSGQSVTGLAQQHWQRFGRHYYARHDYENLSSELAERVVSRLLGSLEQLPGQVFDARVVTQADQFAYLDPVDGSRSERQGIRISFGDQARIVVRLSGTGTQGATLRIYLERFEIAEENLHWNTGPALAPLATVAEHLVKIGEISGRKSADVVT